MVGGFRGRLRVLGCVGHHIRGMALGGAHSGAADPFVDHVLTFRRGSYSQLSYCYNLSSLRIPVHMPLLCPPIYVPSVGPPPCHSGILGL